MQPYNTNIRKLHSSKSLRSVCRRRKAALLWRFRM